MIALNKVLVAAMSVVSIGAQAAGVCPVDQSPALREQLVACKRNEIEVDRKHQLIAQKVQQYMGVAYGQRRELLRLRERHIAHLNFQRDAIILPLSIAQNMSAQQRANHCQVRSLAFIQEVREVSISFDQEVMRQGGALRNDIGRAGLESNTRELDAVIGVFGLGSRVPELALPDLRPPNCQ